MRGLQSVNAVDNGHAGCLLFINDDTSGQNFLCDTGAKVSILPSTALDMCSKHQNDLLETANRTKIPTYGKRQVKLCFNGQGFTWDFVMAKVARLLPGADFLCVNDLLVNMLNCRLGNAKDLNSFRLCSVSFQLQPC